MNWQILNVPNYLIADWDINGCHLYIFWLVVMVIGHIFCLLNFLPVQYDFKAAGT